MRHPTRESPRSSSRRTALASRRRNAGGRNAEADFRGQKRSNDTHVSATYPDARLYRKGKGEETKLCFIGHGLMENRHGLLVDASLTLYRARRHCPRCRPTGWRLLAKRLRSVRTRVRSARAHIPLVRSPCIALWSDGGDRFCA